MIDRAIAIGARPYDEQRRTGGSNRDLRMTEAVIGTIASAAAAPPGSFVQVMGSVVAMRQLGKLTFIVIRDAFSEIQAVISGHRQAAIKDWAPPFYATVSGVLRRRPDCDVRAETPNGSIELETHDLHIHERGGRRLGHPLDQRLRFVTLLQSRGFLDVSTLARTFAPAYCGLLSTAEALGAAKHLAYVLGPCRWSLVTDDCLYFGLSPGFVADVKTLLDEPSAETARELLDQVSWYEDFADPSAAHAPVAYGAVRLAANGDLIGDTGYWRHRHSIAHLSDGLVATATDRSTPDDAGVRSLREGLARGEALLRAIAGSEGSSSTAIILRDLTEFDLQARHTEQLFALFPSLERRLAHVDGEQQFEILWSILGNDHVKAVFSSREAVARLKAGIEAGLFSDYNVVRVLDPGALKSIDALTRGFTDRDAVERIDTMFGSCPGVSASACYLMEELDRSGLDWGRCVAVAHRGIASRIAFAAASLGLASAEEIAAWRSDLAARLKHVFSNNPLDEPACWSAFEAGSKRFSWAKLARDAHRCDDSIFDLVHLTFGAGLVAYEESARMYTGALDCSRHWASAGIDFGGERWDRAEQRFDLGDFWLYPSKNRPAILAKSCSGICSARNLALFNRADHFQYTLVDPAEVIAVGTVQMYVNRDAGGREIWVIRGLNPSDKITIEPVGFAIEIMDTLASLARHNNVSALVCADGAGLFAADSSRVSIRAVLRRLAGSAKRVDFEKPLHIFDYHERQISISSGWQIWP